MVGVALLGAGIFAKMAHLPAIEACSKYSLKAVYSRSQLSAAALAEKAKAPIDVYHDDPAEAGKALDDLLARDDIALVVVCLPILTQPGVIKKALQAGKHVFSEKPIAGDVATAQELVDWHASLARAPLWGVAENFRFVKGLVAAADKVKEIGGDLVGFHLVQATLIAENNPFWLVDWRKVPKYQGGFLLDGGIHNIAGLRLLLTAAGQEVAQVSCVSSLLKERLLPVDTVRAVAKATNGAGGIITMSYGTDFKNVTEIEVITTNGRVTWTPGGGVQAVWISDSGMRQEDSLGIEMDHGVLAEFEAFAESVETRALNPRQSPEEGLKDLRLLEALLRSGEEEAAVKKVGR